MKLTFVITDITSRGGTERTTAVLSRVFREKGHDVSILSLYKSRNELSFDIDFQVKINYIYPHAYILSKGLLYRLRMLFNGLLALRKYLLNSNSSELYICQCFLPAFFIYLLGFANKSIVCDHFKYELYQQPLRFFRNYIYSKFKYVVTLTESDAVKYRKVLKRIAVIPNISPFPIGNKADLTSKRIIAVGRLHPQKGFDLLLKAVEDLFIQYPDWSLDIYGEGDDNLKLSQEVNDLELQNFVHFKGYVNNVREEMLKSSIYVLSSRYEGLPMVLLEAMSCGLAIVSFKCPEGPEDMLAPNAGYLVEAENTVELRNALSEVMSDHSLREKLAINAQRKILAYSTDNVYALWCNLFHLLMKN